MSDNAIARYTSRTKGRAATEGVIPGRFALSVGAPELPCPPGWRWSALSEVAQLESGHTPSRKHPEYWNEGIPWIGIKDAVLNHGSTVQDTYQHISELGLANSSARLLPRGTVCLSRTASVGFVVVMGRPMATSQDFVNWVCGPALEPLFLKYVLLAERESLLRFASGTTHQTIYYPEAKAFHVLLPPLEEQRAILRVLCPLDDKIELNRQTNQTLEAMARALFKSWFVDFDPVRNKTGHAPVGAALPAFPDRFDDDGLPAGWRRCPVGDVIKVVGGGTPSTEEPSFWGGPHAWARPKDLSGLTSHILIRTERTLTDRGLAMVSSGLLPRGTVLLSSRAPIGYLAITDMPVAVNQGFIAMVCNGTISNYYALHWCRENMGLIEARASGTTFPEISKSSFRPMPILVPSPSAIDLFNSTVGPLYESITQSLYEIETLVALRDQLLPRLLSGELRVRDAERVVEAAV